MRAVIPILVIAIAAAAGAFMYLDPLRDVDAEYRDANMRMFEELPHPEGAQQISLKQSSEGVAAFLGAADGWILVALYTPPPNVPVEQVIDFYKTGMPEGWSLEVEESPVIDIPTGTQQGTKTLLIYTRGDSVASIDFTNLVPGGDGTYEIRIDDKGKEP